MYVPLPVVSRTKVWVCGRFLPRMAGLNPAGDMDVCLVLITSPEESYRMWCVAVCDLETSKMRRHGTRWA